MSIIFVLQNDSSLSSTLVLFEILLLTPRFISVLPLIAVSGLKMRRGKKLGVALIFATGFLYVRSIIPIQKEYEAHGLT